MAPAGSRTVSPTTSPPLLLLLALLACAAAGDDSICEKANCGKGNCTVLPPPTLFPYKCDCDPGWSRTFEPILVSPCAIPNCSLDKACFNLSLAPPKGIPITDICVAVNCGPGGTCKKTGDGFFSYTCECQPGYVNLLNLTGLPCVKNCFFGMDCAAVGLAPPPSPPPSSPPPSLAPPGNHDSSGAPRAPPPSPKGNATALGPVSLLSVLQLLLLASLGHGSGAVITRRRRDAATQGGRAMVRRKSHRKAECQLCPAKIAKSPR